MDTVLGVSMAPTAVRMVLVASENADGGTVDEGGFDVNAADAPTLSGPDQVISAILGTREGAAESGYQLRSTGVTWTNPVEAAALRDALAARKVENVMLVSAFLAAAALAQVVGSSVGYAQTALLFVEPATATLAVVDTSDGSITDVHRRPLRSGDRVAELSAMASGAEALATRPDGLFVVGSGVDIAPIKAQLEAATKLVVSAPEEPETALARGAALASANAPLFSSSTAALAYAQNPGTGAVDPYAVSPGYFDVAADGRPGEQALAYSAVPDEDADAYTAVADERDFVTGAYTGPQTGLQTGVVAVPRRSGRGPFTLVASGVAAIVVVGVVALVVALAVGMRPTAGVRSNPGQNMIAPSQQAAPAPAPAAPVPAPAAPPPAAPAPEPAASPPAVPAPAATPPARAPANTPPAAAAPAPAPAYTPPAPVAPVPEPAAPAPPEPAAPAPVAPEPAAPAPEPAAPAPAPPPVAPIPIPVPIPLPRIFSPPVQGPPLQPWGGDHGGGGWGHGGGFPGGGFGGGHGGGFGGGHGGGFGRGHGGGFGIPGLGF